MFRIILTSVPALSLLLCSAPAMAAELTFMRSFSYPGPSGLAYDPHYCGIWIANETKTVVMVSPYGDEIMQFTSDLTRVDAIAVVDGLLVLSDGNGRYQHVDRMGTAQGAAYRLAEGLNDTDGLFVDGDRGEFWVADDSLAQLVRTRDDGTVLQRIEGAHLSPPLMEPQGITRDPVSGNLLVVDDADASDSLFEFTPDGRLLDVVPLGDGGWDAEGITIQPDTRTLFVGYDDSDVVAAFRYSPSSASSALMQASDPGGCVISGTIEGTPQG